MQFSFDLTTDRSARVSLADGAVLLRGFATPDAEALVKDAALRLLEQAAAAPPLPADSVVAEMRALRARIKPDPEGWTTRDYVRQGRVTPL